ncbi:hypothetical protein Tco_0652010 [Tanacetum coccineum]|uniref:Reverse transcriptase Ty1/copia-type domain-containing protein n=1 Tax=Tanacetum coccineum TaxID=301880 RepID=A0ABQ4WX31_9ASTR
MAVIERLLGFKPLQNEFMEFATYLSVGLGSYGNSYLAPIYVMVIASQVDYKVKLDEYGQLGPLLCTIKTIARLVSQKDIIGGKVIDFEESMDVKLAFLIRWGDLQENLCPVYPVGFEDQQIPTHVSIVLMKRNKRLYQAKPTKKHFEAIKRVFRYLKGTIHMGLWYPKDNAMSLTAYADADHAGCQDSRRSTSGSAQFLGDRLVSWSSKKQRSTAISTTEAEYIASMSGSTFMLSGCCAA